MAGLCLTPAYFWLKFERAISWKRMCTQYKLALSGTVVHFKSTQKFSNIHGQNSQEHMATECMNCIQHKQNVIEAYARELQILELLDHFNYS